MRAGWDDGAGRTLLFEDESQYNYIAVRQWGSERHLKLNEGVGIHSVYHPDAGLEQRYLGLFFSSSSSSTPPPFRRLKPDPFCSSAWPWAR